MRRNKNNTRRANVPSSRSLMVSSARTSSSLSSSRLRSRASSSGLARGDAPASGSPAAEKYSTICVVARTGEPRRLASRGSVWDRAGFGAAYGGGGGNSGAAVASGVRWPVDRSRLRRPGAMGRGVVGRDIIFSAVLVVVRAWWVALCGQRPVKGMLGIVLELLWAEYGQSKGRVLPLSTVGGRPRGCREVECVKAKKYAGQACHAEPTARCFHTVMIPIPSYCCYLRQTTS
jgi:hypothetical protein